MKKNDLFSEKMPSSLKSRILDEADEHLKKNASAERRSFLTWLLASGAVAATAAFAFMFVRQNTSDHQNLDLAQSIDFLEDIQSEEDFELLADLDIIEDLDLVVPVEDES